MSEETLSVLTEKALSTGAQSVSFVWQGGEPTLTGRARLQQGGNNRRICRKRRRSRIGLARRIYPQVISTTSAGWTQEQRLNPLRSRLRNQSPGTKKTLTLWLKSIRSKP